MINIKNIVHLGKISKYITKYNKSLLHPIARFKNRRKIGINLKLPFTGYDILNAFEISWLNLNGKPEIAVAEIIINAKSPFLIESKSLKLYLNSLNSTKFSSCKNIENIIYKDLSEKTESIIDITLIRPHNFSFKTENNPIGTCIDNLDVKINEYLPNKNFLYTSDEIVKEIIFSNLLKSNCLITNQPDWGSLQITYDGKKINHKGLLKYIISLRNYNEFHEHCVEKIFVDIMHQCHPSNLTVYARYTRRGGIDINPLRSTQNVKLKNIRLFRQ